MERLVVSEISFEMEKTIYVPLARRCLCPFMATGQYSNRMTSLCQALGHFMAPLCVAAWAGGGKEVREKKNPHEGMNARSGS
jgi:hypothetical protein